MCGLPSLLSFPAMVKSDPTAGLQHGLLEIADLAQELPEPHRGRLLAILRERTGAATQDPVGCKKVEAPKPASELELRLIVDHSADLIMAYDMDRKLLYVNHAIESLTRYTVQEIRSQHFIKGVHPEDETRLMKLRDGLYEGRDYSRAEFRRITRNGEVKWSLASWSPLYNEQGKQIGVQGCERDMTDQK